MERLKGALKPDEDKLRSKGIASVRSRVANLCDLFDDKALETAGDIEAFTKYLTDWLSEGFGVTPEELTEYLRLAGFRDIRQYGHLSLRRPGADAQRIFFAARKDA